MKINVRCLNVYMKKIYGRNHEINTGMYVGSHLRYWDVNEFTIRIAKKCLIFFNQALKA
jgi:hypothetical protein